MTKKQLILKINDVLGNYQFSGNGPLWNRDYANFVDVVDLQFSKSKGLVTVNVGVADKFVIRACWGWDGADMVDEPSCTVRARLGELLYNRDVWWSLADNEDIEDLIRGIQDVAIPFIQLNHHVDHIIESLEKDPAARRYPPGVLYLALLYYRKGESTRCRDIFKSMKLTGPWSKKAFDILGTLN